MLSDLSAVSLLCLAVAALLYREDMPRPEEIHVVIRTLYFSVAMLLSVGVVWYFTGWLFAVAEGRRK